MPRVAREGNEPSRRSFLAAGVALAAWPIARSVADDPPERSGAFVLDDADPKFDGPRPRGDGITRFSAEGKPLWSHADLNNCQCYGGNHGVAIDARRDRVYVGEIVDDRVTGYDLDGNQIFRVGDIDVSALAVEPNSGNIWVTGSNGRAQKGKTIVLDPSGKVLATHDIGGFDIAYDSGGRSFWIANHEQIHRLDLEGEPILANGPKATYAFVSVAADPIGGGAWFAERDHPQVKGSVNRVVFVDGDGEIKKQVGREGWNPFGIVCEPRSRTAWVVNYRKSLTRVPFDGDEVQDFRMDARAVAVGVVTGDVWVTTGTDLLRIDPATGKTLVQAPLAKPSDQSWIAAF